MKIRSELWSMLIWVKYCLRNIYLSNKYLPEVDGMNITSLNLAQIAIIVSNEFV